MANGLRHGASTADSAAPRPDARIVAVSSAPPARDTTPLPVPSTRTRGYNPLRFPTWNVPSDRQRQDPQQSPILPGQEHFSRPDQSTASPGELGGPASVDRMGLRQARALRPGALPAPASCGALTSAAPLGNTNR